MIGYCVLYGHLRELSLAYRSFKDNLLLFLAVVNNLQALKIEVLLIDYIQVLDELLVAKGNHFRKVIDFVRHADHWKIHPDPPFIVIILTFLGRLDCEVNIIYYLAYFVLFL